MRSLRLILALLFLCGLCSAQVTWTQGLTKTAGITSSFAPSLLASPDPIAFGNVLLGQTGLQVVTITSGGGSFTITGITSSDNTHFPIGADNCVGVSLPSTASCTFTLQFSPTVAGAHSATVTVSTTIGNFTIPASGTGQAAYATISITPNPLNFGNVTLGTSSAPEAFTIAAPASSPIPLGPLTVGSPGTSFFVVSQDNCTGNTLPPGSSCTVLVIFTPNAVGDFTDTISISDNTATNPDSEGLMGTGTSVATPTVVIPGCGSPPCALPEGIEHTPYSFTPTATGGTPPYVSWALTGCTLQAGLSFNTSTGAITGTPTATGTIDCTLSVTDSNSEVGSTTITLTIIAPATANFYISPAGSDSNTCTTVGSPCLTFTKIQSLVKGQPCSGGALLIDVEAPTGNTHFWTQSLSFGNTDGPGGNPATSSCVVTYQAYPGQYPIISAGTPITSTWHTSSSVGLCPQLTAAGTGTCYYTSFSASANYPERLYYQDLGANNYGGQYTPYENGFTGPLTNDESTRLRPRLGATSYTITSVAKGTTAADGVGTTVYTGNFSNNAPLNCGVTAAATLSCATIYIEGFTNASNNGVFRTITVTPTQMTVVGATGVAETASAFAIYQTGNYGHSTNPYHHGNGTTSGSIITCTSGPCGQGAQSLANGDLIYYTPSGAANPGSYTVSSVATNSITVKETIGTNSAGTYEAYDGLSFSTAATVNGITNAVPAGSYASCSLGNCRLVPFAKWLSDIQIPSAISVSGGYIVTNCGTKCPTYGGYHGIYQSGYRYLLENFAEGFTQGGQWYLDCASGNPNAPQCTLYYAALAGENPNTDLVWVDSGKNVFSGSSLAYTTFGPGLTLEGGYWTPPATGFEGEQIDSNLDASYAGVFCNPCTHVTFTGDIVRDMTAAAVVFAGASANDNVIGSAVWDSGAYGGRNGVSPTSTGDVSSSNDVPHSITWSQSYIWSAGRIGIASSDNLMTGLANGITYDHLDIYDGPHDGVENCVPGQPQPGMCADIGTSSFGIFGLSFTGVRIHNVMMAVSSDGAGIYANSSISNSIGSGTGNSITGTWISDINSSAVNGEQVDVGAHGTYFDSYSGLWTVSNDVILRVTAAPTYMNFGPNVANQPNTYSNLIIANVAGYPNQGLGGCQGNNEPAPSSSIKQFVRQNILCYFDLPHNTANSGSGPLVGSPTATQQYVENLYCFGGTSCPTAPSFSLSGLSGNVNFATWQGTYGEDTTGSITTSFGFTAPGHCSQNSIFACPYPALGQYDDFRFGSTGTGSGPGHGFVAFPQTFGVTDAGVPTPPFVPDYYPVAVLPLNQY